MYSMKKKIISTTLALAGLILVGYVILVLIGLFRKQDAGVLIESEPESTVYINSKEVGKTPYEANFRSGEINLRIMPIDNSQNLYDDYETKINLVPGIRTIVKRVFRPREDNSSGAIVSFEKIGGQKSFVTVVTIPDGAQVIIDNKNYGYTPIKVEIPAGDHTLSVAQDGYLEKKLSIKVYKGYNLTAAVKLGKSGEKADEVEPASQNVNLGKIKINKNDAGFLRVRSGANTGFPEVGRVKPDEIYDVLEEGENSKWYKIKFINSENIEIDGWVAAEFVTKL